MSNFSDNFKSYMKNFWYRAPAMLLLASIFFFQRTGVFHIVGIVFFAWLALEIMIYVYRACKLEESKKKSNAGFPLSRE
jgi:hypothetical protein